MTTPTKTPALNQLINIARKAHDGITGAEVIGAIALAAAFDAGNALNAAKAQVKHGDWAATVAKTEIPPSTARLYMRLAAHRDAIVAAGCKSIREARTLLTDRKPPRKARARGTRGPTATTEPEEDRYEEGYRAGYVKGRIDGMAAAKASNGSHSGNGTPLPPNAADVKWILRRVHPDVVSEKDSLKATRVSQWLNELLERVR